KPGPGSLSEAIVSGLPVIVERNAHTMVHERYNTDWIIENQVGLVLRSFAEIASAVAPMLDPERLAGFCAPGARIRDRAVFEVPAILGALVGGGCRPVPHNLHRACLLQRAPLPLSDRYGPSPYDGEQVQVSF